MDSEIVADAFPFFRIFKDGRVVRFMGTDTVSPSREGPVASKDVKLDAEAGLFVRVYLPTLHDNAQNVPVIVYIHGGGFAIESASSPTYHNYLNLLAEEANVICVSVEYRRVPEHRLPVAYDDCFAALQWLSRQAQTQQSPPESEGEGFQAEEWLLRHADFSSCFLAGDSAGANIVHEMGIRAGEDGRDWGPLGFAGAFLIHPFFCGEEAIGSELSPEAEVFKKTGDALLGACLPPGEDKDYPPFNPVGPRSPSLAKLVFPQLLVIVAGKDGLKDRVILYYEALIKAGKVAHLMIAETETHVFHLRDLRCANATQMMKRISDFIHSIPSSSSE
uniref:Alpha/beta hydrolase fold-3 domain-containing protein n=1 Tax=Araucaria cunninghamii TaxID=56994 RepID=A0A0D6QU55_ARACU